MLFSSIVLALVAAVSAQGPGGSVTSDVSPDSSTPSSCQKTFQGGQGTFTFNTHNLTKRDSIPEFEELEKRQQIVLCGSSLTLTLNNGKLLDSKGRTGYIAANRQFQFDGPPQAGAIYTAGWSYCSNNSLALGGSYIYYNCLSGTFSNIYDQSQGDQCYPVTIELIPCQASGAPVTVATSVPTSAASSMAMMTSVTSVPTAMSASAMTAVPPPASVSTPASVVTPPASVVPPPSAANTTMAAPSGTGAPTTGATTPSPSPFTGAGSIVAVGSKVVGLVAGLAAFALF